MKRTKDNWTPYPFGEDGYLVTTKDEPIWNRPFRVVGIQMVGIDNQPMGAYLMELNTKKNGLFGEELKPEIYKGVSNILQWRKRKEEISNKYVRVFQELGKGRLLPKDARRLVVTWDISNESENRLDYVMRGI